MWSWTPNTIKKIAIKYVLVFKIVSENEDDPEWIILKSWTTVKEPDKYKTIMPDPDNFNMIIPEHIVLQITLQLFVN